MSCLLFPLFSRPGVGGRPLPAWELWRSGLQTVYETTHHQSQPQGPALLPGERARDQSLTAALQRLPQIAARVKMAALPERCPQSRELTVCSDLLRRYFLWSPAAERRGIRPAGGGENHPEPSKDVGFWKPLQAPGALSVPPPPARRWSKYWNWALIRACLSARLELFRGRTSLMHCLMLHTRKNVSNWTEHFRSEKPRQGHFTVVAANTWSASILD